jgi:alpha-methylacyl-CoA racemase
VPGPLSGTTIVELAGIGPGPFAGMLLADMGADVIRVERPGGNPMAGFGHSIMFRSRRGIAVDLKHSAGVEVVLRLIEGADAIFEGFRPGVAERLGLGPDVCLARNPRLVYGRMTGWGQEGPLAGAAGHDINYIALTGALHAIGRAGAGPVPPLNLVGDFGGGGMLLAYGMVCALLHTARTGQGQVVDAAMVDGSAALMAMFYGLRAQGLFDDERGTHLLDGGAPFYDTYETADGRWVAVGPLEPQFFGTFCELLGLDAALRPAHGDPARWPELRARLAEVFRSRTRDEWDALLLGTDACYAPVLGLAEAPGHPHHVARGTFVEVDGVTQPAPVPRFSASAPDAPRPEQAPGTHTREVLLAAGLSGAEIDALLAQGAVAVD